MESPIPDSDSEVIQTLVDRFARAKWITGSNIVTPNWYDLKFTELGQERMNALAKKSRPFSNTSGKVRWGILAQLRWGLHMVIICRSLCPPQLTREEARIIGALACRHGRIGR